MRADTREGTVNKLLSLTLAEEGTREGTIDKSLKFNLSREGYSRGNY